MPTSTEGRPVTVAVLTYRRVELLPALLSELASQLGEIAPPQGSSVLVLDNDPQQSARAIVENLGEPVRYVSEPIPGIAAARQKALDSTPDDHLLVFIDDDETPSPEWLSRMVGTWALYGMPAGVAGRVVPRYEVAPSAWIVAGAFFVRRSLPTGTPVSAAGAGNLLLDLRQLKQLGLRFDTSLGLRGGEDTLITRQLTRRGGRLIWCEEAQAADLVPASRANPRWVLRRAYSHGSAHAMACIRLEERSLNKVVTRLRLLFGGIGRIPVGLVRHLFGRASGQLRHQARGLWLIWRGAGMVAGTLGSGWSEYARGEAPARLRRGTPSGPA